MYLHIFNMKSADLFLSWCCKDVKCDFPTAVYCFLYLPSFTTFFCFCVKRSAFVYTACKSVNANNLNLIYICSPLID